MHQDIESVLYSEEAIRECVVQMGSRITQDYAGRDLLLVGVLKGSFIFMADLARAIDLPIETDFMVASSYGSGTESSGVLNITKDLSVPVEGKHILIAEDILDTGLTLSLLTKDLRKRGAASVEVAVLFDKDVPHAYWVPCAYTGFRCPDAFLVGCGLDYAEKYRNLPYVGVLKPEVYENRD